MSNDLGPGELAVIRRVHRLLDDVPPRLRRNQASLQQHAQGAFVARVNASLRNSETTVRSVVTTLQDLARQQAR